MEFHYKLLHHIGQTGTQTQVSHSSFPKSISICYNPNDCFTPSDTRTSLEERSAVQMCSGSTPCQFLATVSPFDLMPTWTLCGQSLMLILNKHSHSAISKGRVLSAYLLGVVNLGVLGYNGSIRVKFF